MRVPMDQLAPKMRWSSFAIIASTLAIAVSTLLLRFDAQAFAFAFASTAVFGYAMGIFHHMLFSHRSFRAKTWIENLGGLLGTLTWRGPMAGPVRYAALHRIHHQYSDHEGDPHSPVYGRFHAAIGWMWNYGDVFADPKSYERLAPRVAANPFLAWLDRNVNLVQFLWGLTVFAVASFLPLLAGKPADFERGLLFATYAVFVKTLLLLVLANAVDLINHGVGYRNYETTDRSTNSALMGIVHLGGAISWHNNHHAHPAYFMVRKKWWEFDMHYVFIKVLSFFGLTWSIKVLDESKEQEAASASKQYRLKDFLRLSSTQAAMMIFGRIVLFISSLAALTLLYQSSWPWIAKIPVAMMLMIVGAVATQNLGLVGHEGAHFSLARRRVTSLRIGTWVSALVPFHFNIGFAVNHARHHRYANTARDPDFVAFSPLQKNLWGRLIQTRMEASRRYFKDTLRIAMQGASEEDRELGLSDRDLRRLSIENLLVSGLVLATYVLIGLWVRPEFGAALATIYLSAGVLSSLRPFLEHEGTTAERGQVARTFSSPLLDLMFGGVNYHHAHHLYPAVPSYRMKVFQEWLVTNRLLGNQPVALYSVREAVRLVIKK